MSSEPKKQGLGVFLGVFTPTILTILGAIMFVRLGWVVGVAGIWGTVAIVLIANLITLLTSLSVSSLATNTRVGVGGAYFLVSRSLGLEIGGAVGIPLYLSQVLSVTLYSYALAESLQSLLWADLNLKLTTAIIVIVVTAVASKSTELTLKLQIPIMVLIGAAIISLLVGADWIGGGNPPVGSFAEGSNDIGFWGVFAVFFPAVTGVLAGVSLSGDLKDPGSSIPKGVLSAVAVGALVYLVVPFALDASATTEELQSNRLIWMSIAVVPWLVLPGLWGAILSSAFGSVLSAPRTLQALADDRLVPSVLGRLDEDSGEPQLGVYLSGGLALVLALSLDGLNAVASWVTIFFLTTYGALNCVALIETLVADPSYRPRIRIPWWVAAGGAIGCFIAMFAINPVACGIAICCEAAIFWVLRQRAIETEWGDARNGLMLSLIHAMVVNFTDARKDARNWRPHILVMTPEIESSLDVVRLASNFGTKQGILTVMELVEADVEHMHPPSEYLTSKRAMLRSAGVDAFCEHVCLPELTDAGIAAAAQAHGFGDLNANTLMLQWHGPDKDQLVRFLRLSRQFSKLEKCTLLFRKDTSAGILPTSKTPLLLVWWAGLEANGDLMLLLAYLMSRSHAYHGAKILLRTIVEDEGKAAAWQASAHKLARQVRMPVQTDAIVRKDGQTIHEAIVEGSQGASLVFLGMGEAEPGAEDEMADRLMSLTNGLPDTLMVRNGGPFRGRLV